MTTEAGKDCLRLEVKIIESVGWNPASVIQQALNTIPTIRQAQQANQLDLLLEEHPSTTLSNPAKRVILDYRSLS
jgi:hypothetical protein